MFYQPQILSPEESALAAEQFGQVYAFLAENDLPEDVYYDYALDGFLKAVRQYFREPGKNFKEAAWTCMSKECSAYEERQYSLPPVLSFCESDRSAYTLEETVANARDTLEEVIASLALEETMAGFDEVQRRIVKLLYAGYSHMDIAFMMHMSIRSVRDEIYYIQKELRGTPLMMAA